MFTQATGGDGFSIIALPVAAKQDVKKTIEIVRSQGLFLRIGFPLQYILKAIQVKNPGTIVLLGSDPIHDAIDFSRQFGCKLKKTSCISILIQTYSRSQKLLYAAAVLKSHIPLGNGGLDAIYTIDPATGTPNATPWLQLTDDLGIAVSAVSANPQYADNAARGVDTPPQNDASAFTDAMKVGIGDIDLSADEKTLYVVNVYDKKVYAIDVATKTLKGSYAIPAPSCSNGVARPWALGGASGQDVCGCDL